MCIIVGCAHGRNKRTVVFFSRPVPWLLATALYRSYCEQQHRSQMRRLSAMPAEQPQSQLQPKIGEEGERDEEDIPLPTEDQVVWVVQQ